MDDLYRPLPQRGKASALVERIRESIHTHRLAPGTNLPASRSFAQELGVSRNVVLSAYAKLEAQGLVQGCPGAGTVVKGVSKRSKVRARVDDEATPRFDFQFASVSQDERTQEHWIARIRHHAQRSLRRYAAPQGLGTLREEVAVFLARYRDIHVHPDQILLVSGSQQAIDLVCRSFAAPADSVWVESPAYRGAAAVMGLCHLKVQHAQVDEQGLSVSALRSGKPGKILFCTPSHQIPTGRLMSQNRREALLAWAEKHRCLILEDDYDGLPYYGKSKELSSLYSMATPGRVLHVGTFSLLLFPGIRIGYVCGTPEQIDTLTRSCWLAGRHSPELQQAALCDLMKSARFDQHLARRRRTLVGKRSALLASIQSKFSDRARVWGDHAGTFLTLDLACRAPRALMRALGQDRELGVQELPRSDQGSVRQSGLKLELCYSGLTVSQIEAGVRRIHRHWKSQGS